MYLYIVRHGQPFYSPVEKLTEKGWKQARAIAPRLVQSGITKIYASCIRNGTADGTCARSGYHDRTVDERKSGMVPFCKETAGRPFDLGLEFRRRRLVCAR